MGNKKGYLFLEVIKDKKDVVVSEKTKNALIATIGSVEQLGFAIQTAEMILDAKDITLQAVILETYVDNIMDYYEIVHSFGIGFKPNEKQVEELKCFLMPKKKLEDVFLLDLYSVARKVYEQIKQNDNIKERLSKFIKNYLHPFKDKKILIACDSDSKSSWRKKLYSAYKNNRKKDENFYSIMYDLEKELVSKGYLLYKHNELEADDIIAYWVERLKKDNYKNIVITNDKDFYQLLDSCNIINHRKKIKITKETLLEEYGLKPSQWRDYLALIGDVSDNISGAKGIGEKTAKKLLQEYGNLKSIYLEVRKEKSSIAQKTKSKLIDSYNDVLLAYKLVGFNTKIKPKKIKMEDF